MKARRNFTYLLLIISLSLLTISASSAAPQSPFKGLWRAVDLDDSNIQLSIAGGGRGVYRLTFTDDYWSICGGLPGLGRGTGYLDGSNPNVLHTTMVIRCLTLREVYEFQWDAVYDPGTDTINYQFVDWSRVGH